MHTHKTMMIKILTTGKVMQLYKLSSFADSENNDLKQRSPKQSISFPAGVDRTIQEVNKCISTKLLLFVMLYMPGS